MGQSLLFRLFGLGRMPEPLRSEVLAQQPVIFAEGLAGWLRPHGSLPGGIVMHAIRSVHGGFAYSETRLVVSVGKHLAVDLEFADAAEGAPAIVTLSDSGLRLEVDMARAVRDATGTLRLDFEHPIGPRELGRLPATRLGYRIDERGAARLFLKYRWTPRL